MLLISDSNILIDMEAGGLLSAMFALPDTFAVPDILFEEELAPHYPELPTLGLRVLELRGQSIEFVIQLKKTYGSLGDNDLFAWALAHQEQCPLLTGDRRLAQAARSANIQVQGTLWLIERLVLEQHITIGQAAQGYQQMRHAGSRLPWGEVAQQLERWGWQNPI